MRRVYCMPGFDAAKAGEWTRIVNGLSFFRFDNIKILASPKTADLVLFTAEGPPDGNPGFGIECLGTLDWPPANTGEPPADSPPEPWAAAAEQWRAVGVQVEGLTRNLERLLERLERTTRHCPSPVEPFGPRIR